VDNDTVSALKQLTFPLGQQVKVILTVESRMLQLREFSLFGHLSILSVQSLHLLECMNSCVYLNFHHSGSFLVESIRNYPGWTEVLQSYVR
jgi:hypothetical protein